MVTPKFILTKEIRKTIPQDKELSDIIRQTIYGKSDVLRFFQIYNQIKTDYNPEIADAYLHIYNSAVQVMLGKEYLQKNKH